MSKISDTKRRPLRTEPPAPTVNASRLTRIRTGDEALSSDPKSALVGLAQYLRESMLVRSAPWPTSPR